MISNKALTITDKWEKLEDLLTEQDIEITIEDDITYHMQNKNSYGSMLVYEGTTKPEDDGRTDYPTLFSFSTLKYTKTSGIDLYVKSEIHNELKINIWG